MNNYTLLQIVAYQMSEVLRSEWFYEFLSCKSCEKNLAELEKFYAPLFSFMTGGA